MSPTPSSPARPLRVALVGAGIFAKRTHLPTILSQKNRFSLVALHSRSRKSAAALHAAIPDAETRGAVRLYHEEDGRDNLTALLASPDIDVVVIALPVGAQEEVVKRALQSGKHVLSEKPIAGTAAAARELVDWYTSITSPRPVWVVAENWRAEPAVLHAAELVRTRGRGVVRTFSLSCLLETKPDNQYVATGWRVGAASVVTGGFLMDGGVHWVAMLRACLGGEIARVAAFTGLSLPYCAPVDTVSGAVVLAPSTGGNGAAGTINICFAASGRPFDVSMMVICETGTVSVRCGPAKSGGGGRVFTVTWTPEGGDGEDTREFDFAGIEAEFQHFADVVSGGTSNGKPDTRLDLSPQQALADVLVVEGLIRSGEQGGAPVSV
ncbi:hypothetical protein HDU88_008349 [Geranomyces variabilis]|nr:hypothetical protein HDU88_008349 [Geranomyces variabilis]